MITLTGCHTELLQHNSIKITIVNGASQQQQFKPTLGGECQVLSWLGVGLVISMSLVQFPARALWSVLWQDFLSHIASVYPAAKWEPSINKAVLRACALYAASCSGKSIGGLKWFPCVQAC